MARAKPFFGLVGGGVGVGGNLSIVSPASGTRIIIIKKPCYQTKPVFTNKRIYFVKSGLGVLIYDVCAGKFSAAAA